MNFLAYADGNHDLLEIADRIDVSVIELIDIAKTLSATNLVKEDSSIDVFMARVGNDGFPRG